MRNILTKFKNGELSLKETEKLLKLNYLSEIEDMYADLSREYRTGIPEVVYGKGKKPDEIAKGLYLIAEKNGIGLSTKVENIEDVVDNLKNIISDKYTIEINERGKTIILRNKNYNYKKIGKVGILTGGTSDIPIAEECKETLKLMNCETITYYDVGIAGLHRLSTPLKHLINEEVSCIIAIAGMDGILPSFTASLVDIPVIGVPTSTGYGLKETPLLTMLHSCVPGLVVVNMDNGFGAAVFAGLIVREINKKLKR